MSHITLIHPFKVSSEQENEFLNAWERVDQYMKKQSGFIETKLHRSINTKELSAFSFINIALWDSASSFQKAISHPDFNILAKPVLEFSGGAGLYEVHKE